MATRPPEGRQIDPAVRWAALSVIVGTVLVFLGMSDRTVAGVADTAVIELHNNRAEPSVDCPAGGPSWHFVIAPNDGTYRFVEVSLMIGDSLYTFSEDDLIRNGQQRDNVFIRVPDGVSLDGLDPTGSFAEISPAPQSTDAKFVLSHVCEGTPLSSSTTQPYFTTTTSPGASTSVAPTTTVSDTSPSSTSPASSSTSSTTSVPASTTSSTLAATTTIPAPTTTVPTSSTAVPSTTVAGPTTTGPATTAVVTSTTVAVTTTVPASTTTAPSSTTTSSSVAASSTTTVPTTSTIPADSTTSTVEQAGPATTTTTTTPSTTTTPATGSPTTTTVAPQLPTTGTGGGRLALLVGTALILLGGLALISASRFGEPTPLG